MTEWPQIFAFYSFKGGVGRSMAVLNLAYALVAKGRNVLVLDMDLEAPGLSGFMSRTEEIPNFARHDLVDLLRWAKETAQRVSEDEPLDPSSLPPLSDYAIRVPPEKLASLPHEYSELGRLDVIPIDETRNYYDRLSEVAVAGMDRDTLLRVGSLLRSWLKSGRIPLEVPDYYGPVPDEDRSAPYDYVLLDSRTGITEVGGLCIGPLSDQLVVLCGLNDQNVEGTRQFLTEVGVLKPPSDAASLLSKPTLFVASPLPIGEMTTKNERVERLRTALGLNETKFHKLSYHPQMALMETIFVRDHEEEFLTREYHSILDQLLERAEDRAEFDSNLMGELVSTKPLTDQSRRSVGALLRSASTSNFGPMLSAVLQIRNLKTVTEDQDFQLMDRIFRAVDSAVTTPQFDNLARWSDLLSRWSQRSTDPALAARRFEEAINRIDRVIDSPRTSHKDRAKALVNRGFTFSQQGNSERAIADYTAVIEMPDAPADQKAIALRNRGITFRQQGNPERAIADYTAVIEMPDAPADQKAKALRNRSFTFGQQGNPEGEIADYTAVIEMPDAPAEQKAHALGNRSWDNFVAGRIKEAIADARLAVSLDPKKVNARGNLAISLLADGQKDDALAAYDAAIELADTDGLADLEKDLREAIARHGALPGADEVRTRIESRAATLKTTVAPQ